MVPATAGGSPAPAIIGDEPSDLPCAGALIVVSPHSHLEITPNVDGTGLTGLTVRDGDRQATVNLHAVLVDETCNQLAINSPIPLQPEPGRLDPGAGDAGHHGAHPDGPPDPGTLTVVPLPELDGDTVVDTPQVQATVVADAPGRSRLTVRHAGALHTVTLPEHVLQDLLDRHRRQLIQAAWQATFDHSPSGGDG